MDSEITKLDEFFLHHGDVGLTVAEKQKFTILEIIPDWGFTTESTKVGDLHLSVFSSIS